MSGEGVVEGGGRGLDEEDGGRQGEPAGSLYDISVFRCNCTCANCPFVPELERIPRKALKQGDVCPICNNPFLEGEHDLARVIMLGT